jgi:hypothetical protein
MPTAITAISPFFVEEADFTSLVARLIAECRIGSRIRAREPRRISSIQMATTGKYMLDRVNRDFDITERTPQ